MVLKNDVPPHVNANATLGVIQGGSMKDYSDLGYFNIITKEYGFFKSLQ